MIDTIVNEKNIKNADVLLLSAPYEGGVSFMGGTSKAPEKIVNCLDSKLELFDRDFLCEPAKKIKTAHRIIESLDSLSPEEAARKISAEYEKYLREINFILLIGGEHGVSFGALDALAKKENPKDVTIVQIDAHQDLRDDNSDYSNENEKFAHSCVIRRAHEIGYNLVQVGIRVYSKYEYDYWQKNKDTITVFEWNGEKIPDISEILKSIKTKKIYISIDVDGFDPAHMPGTGTPVQGGLEWNYGVSLIKKLIQEKDTIGADIVEVSPQKDSVITEAGAAHLVYKIIAQKFNHKLK